MNLDVSQIIAQIIAFLITLWVLKRYGWKPLLGMLQERQAKIKSEFDAIAAEHEKAKQTMQTYENKLNEIEMKARHIIRDATAEGQKIAIELQGEAQSEAREILAQAKVEINDQIHKASLRLKDDVVQMVIKVTEKFLQEKLDDADHKKLIADIVEETK